MTHGFQQQDQTLGSAFQRPTPLPQHGQKADMKTSKAREPRSVSPRPGH